MDIANPARLSGHDTAPRTSSGVTPEPSAAPISRKTPSIKRTGGRVLRPASDAAVTAIIEPDSQEAGRPASVARPPPRAAIAMVPASLSQPCPSKSAPFSKGWARKVATAREGSFDLLTRSAGPG